MGLCEKISWSTTVEDIAPETPGQACCCCCCSICWFMLIILMIPAGFIEVTRLNFGLAKNGVSGVVDLESPMSEGRYYLGFWSAAILFPNTLQTIEFSEEKPEEGVQHLSVLRGRDRDGKRIYLDVSVQYLLSKNKVGAIYQDMLTFYEDIYISELRYELSKACNYFAIADAWENYTNVVSIMQSACETALTRYHATCWGLQLWGIRLESKYESALIRTQVRKQAQRTEQNRKLHTVVRAQTEVLLASYRRNKTVIEAQGEADRYLIDEDAKAKAEKKWMDAQAQAIEIVKNAVKIKNETEMTAEQLIKYQKLVMLSNKSDTNFIVKGTSSLDVSTAREIKQLAQGSLSGSDSLAVGEK